MLLLLCTPFPIPQALQAPEPTPPVHKDSDSHIVAFLQSTVANHLRSDEYFRSGSRRPIPRFSSGPPISGKYLLGVAKAQGFKYVWIHGWGLCGECARRFTFVCVVASCCQRAPCPLPLPLTLPLPLPLV